MQATWHGEGSGHAARKYAARIVSAAKQAPGQTYGGHARPDGGRLGDLGPIPVGVHCMDSENTETNKYKKLSDSFKHGRILGQ